MAGVVFVLALFGYLFLLIDWKELRGILRQGGWGVGCLYALLAILIWAALACPAAVHTAGMHHG